MFIRILLGALFLFSGFIFAGAGSEKKAHSYSAMPSKNAFKDFETPLFQSWQKLSYPELIQCVRMDLPPNKEIKDLFEKLLEEWRSFYLQNDGAYDLENLLRATRFITVKYEGIFQKDGLPYIYTPLKITDLLWKVGGVRNVNTLIAALLEEALEISDSSLEEIETVFNSRVASIVEELTTPPHFVSELNKETQIEHAPFMSLDARLILLADRIVALQKENPYDALGKYKLKAHLKGTNAALEKLLSKELSK